MNLISKKKKFAHLLRSNFGLSIVIAVICGTFGSAVLLSSKAATPTASVESENGSISNVATNVTDATASGGHAVKFGGGSTAVWTNSTLPIKAAFYYPWFPEAWNQQGLNPFTQYHPTLGFYSSTDSTVITNHIDTMIYSGMDAAISSWWGQGSKEDTRFGVDLQASHGKSLKWAPYYECEGNASGGTCTTLSPSVSQIQSDLAYIKSNYASDQNYLHINGKPVIFVYGDGTDSCTTASNWASANASQGFYVVLKVFSGYASCASQPDNWHQYSPAVAEDNQSGHSIAISPGFYKANESAPRLARNLTTWQQNVTDLKNSSAPFKLMTTFNEWGEGSSVESANEWSSATGYGQYIDILHNTLFSGTSDTTPPSTPGSLTVTGSSATQVSLSWTAATDNVAVAHYEITRNGSIIATTDTASSTTFTDGTVAAATQYTYTVKAIDAAGNKSAASNTATTTTPQVDTAPPSVPGGVTATLQSPTSNVVHVAWNASTDTGGSGLRDYLVMRNGTVVATVTAPTTTFDDSTTNYSTQYSYTVAARDNANNTSAASAAATVTTPAPQVPDTQAPDVPTTTASVVSPTQVTVSWTAVQDNPKSGGASGVKGYKVFRNGTQIADVLALSTSTNDGPFSFVSGQSYGYTVLAYDVSGNSSAQSTASSVVPNPVVSAGNYCGNSPTGNKIDTVVVIAEENRSWSGVGMGFSATNMPYVHTVASQCAYFTQDTEVNINDNSAQQYVGAWTGYDSTVTHVSSDCNPSSSCSYTGNNLFRAFRNAGVPHREYVEGATTTCSASGNAAKHIPELYMWDPTDQAACNAEVLPMSQFNFANPPTGYTFITPNLCNDGHDCIDSTVNSWLADPTRLPAIFNSAQYKAGKVLVELWWDEDHPKPNLFACWSCKQVVSTTDPHYSGESLLWLNLLNTPSTNLGGISAGTDIRSIIGTP